MVFIGFLLDKSNEKLLFTKNNAFTIKFYCVFLIYVKNVKYVFFWNGESTKEGICFYPKVIYRRVYTLSGLGD